MKLASLPRSLRQAARLGLIGAAFLSAGSVSAATFSFQLLNNTFSGGDPSFPVADDLTFINLKLTETFADNFTALVPLKDFTGTTQNSLDTGTFELDSDPFTLPNATHGGLNSAVLSGNIVVSGLPFTTQRIVTLQPNPNPSSSFPQLVSSGFSADLFRTPAPGVSVGQISLLDSNNNVVRTTPLNVAVVPESSGIANMVGGLLGLGGLAFLRRRRAAAKAK